MKSFYVVLFLLAWLCLSSCTSSPTSVEVPTDPSQPLPTIPREVGIWIHTGARPLGGYLVVVEFDPEILRLERVEGGPPPFQGTPFFHAQEAQKGKLRLLGYHTCSWGPQGKVLVAKLFFHGQKPGVSSLRIQLEEATTPNGLPILGAQAELSTPSLRVPFRHRL